MLIYLRNVGDIELVMTSRAECALTDRDLARIALHAPRPTKRKAVKWVADCVIEVSKSRALGEPPTGWNVARREATAADKRHGTAWLRRSVGVKYQHCCDDPLPTLTAARCKRLLARLRRKEIEVARVTWNAGIDAAA